VSPSADSPSAHLRARAWAPTVLVLPVLLVLVGCGQESAARADSVTDSSSSGSTFVPSSPSLPPAGPTITTNATDRFSVTAPLTVSVPQGRLSSVTVTGPYGALAGEFNPAGTQWTSSGERAPRSTYQLNATATNAAGGRSTLARTFTTGAAPRTLAADVTPFGGQQVGVGQPIVVRLSAAVSKSRRAAVEKALVVTADKPIGPASWYWWSGSELHYRPKAFWPAHTNVRIAVNLDGVQGGTGLWGTRNRMVSFKVGRALVMRIANSTHRMTVTVDGKQVRTIPVSMGRRGFETRSGIKTVMSHEKSVRMTSESYGGKDFYDEIVQYAQRLTWSGEYLHSAPWSVGAQGRTNVSHGCVNLGPSNAIWLFNQTLVGDPVITTGTGRQMEPGNGTGGDWNISWTNWLAGSALR
jgi:lipoprotein-anchoring transpeptidase ErfK/SrfK